MGLDPTGLDEIEDRVMTNLKLYDKIDADKVYKIIVSGAILWQCCLIFHVFVAF